MTQIATMLIGGATAQAGGDFEPFLLGAAQRVPLVNVPDRDGPQSQCLQLQVYYACCSGKQSSTVYILSLYIVMWFPRECDLSFLYQFTSSTGA